MKRFCLSCPIDHTLAAKLIEIDKSRGASLAKNHECSLMAIPRVCRRFIIKKAVLYVDRQASERSEENTSGSMHTLEKEIKQIKKELQETKKQLSRV